MENCQNSRYPIDYTNYFRQLNAQKGVYISLSLSGVACSYVQGRVVESTIELIQVSRKFLFQFCNFSVKVSL